MKDFVQEVVNGKAVLVDVRGQDEWLGGHAKGAIHLPLDRIAQGKVPTTDKNVPIYLYCASGNRSGMAAQLLANKGYKAENIGGLGNWMAAGGAIEH